MARCEEGQKLAKEYLCPHCQTPMAWYGTDFADNLTTLHQSFQCEKCGFVNRSDGPSDLNAISFFRRA